jgi:soluble lytic murein transglycosylase
LLLLTGCVAGSLGLILGGQTLLRRIQPELTPATAPAQLWRHYRWSFDPALRREAALLLAAKDRESPWRRQQLLRGQGWGASPVAAAVLLQQAITANELGQTKRSQARWQELWQRFPGNPLSADAAYHLGLDDPKLTAELLLRFPAHPAALERAVQTGEAFHLAQHGPRHPGAEAVIRAACQAKTSGAERPDAGQRQTWAKALADLGDGASGLACLQGAPPAPATALSIGRALLRGTADQRRQGEQVLVAMTRLEADGETKAVTNENGVTNQQAVTQNKAGPSAESLEAARLLSEPLQPDASLLAQLPPALRHHSADVAAAEVRLGSRDAANVFKQWPRHPASWQLQWDLARADLLAGRWDQAETWLSALDPTTLPEPLAARQRFWLGFSQAKQGRNNEAQQQWQTLLQRHPPGYYTWRATARLEEARPNPRRQQQAGDQATASLPTLNAAALMEASAAASSAITSHLPWQPLNSGDALVDLLWRLGMTQAALESWQSREQQHNPQTLASAEQHSQAITGARLRLARGDRWSGLDALWRANLRLVSQDCTSQLRLHHWLHPLPFESAFDAAATDERVHEALLRAIAKQESRFSTGVRSPVGAQGLMQLMPGTAAEMAGGPIDAEALGQAPTNARLGARYLNQLLRQWNGNPWLTVASYNAGPGAVAGWRSDELNSDPELWAERIPYPETRIYTKKVLGNLWAYQQLKQNHCADGGNAAEAKLKD